MINISSYSQAFDIPSLVMSYSLIAKMADEYPLKLFDLKNFLILSESKDLESQSYFLPYNLL